jgi:hypothetical protein
MHNRVGLPALSLLLLFCQISIAHAEDAQANARLLESKPNGCGSGWSVYIVPDSIPLANCTFRAACDEHDGCYGKCEGRVKDRSAPQCAYLRCRKGGDLYASLKCKTDATLTKLERDAQKRRSKCDTEIGAKIREINKGRPVCQAFAYVYEKAVREFGDPHFEGIRATANAPDQSQDDYDRAIREFFLHGSKEEFAAFNARPPSFAEPLKYERGKGLVNIPGR